ncbi:Uncharacterized protein PCOAH_00051800 [Plasmodium coatneyi]|uniref:Uncharacterized protein n=1 Tax=Plasmodium coatneyi TaxID=208452 RepID=A0A1B1E724_9APIC|nr:Uncharacterized protein PCOAH_00051800 [Plasmodium coatneyi]ANQ10805.1 Uncharacterized protein PCOAH_00051800 [Plasmodium coatneyi]
MDVEKKLLKSFKEIRKKNVRRQGRQEQNVISDFPKWEDNFSCDEYSVDDVVRCVRKGGGEDDDTGKYKNVFNTFENEINYYLGEYVEEIICSSVTGRKDNGFPRWEEETLRKPTDVIFQHLIYGSLFGENLRRYECSSRYFKPTLVEDISDFSDASTSSNDAQRGKHSPVRDITHEVK